MATGKVTGCFSKISAKEFDRIEKAAEAVAKDAGRQQPINQDYVTVVKGLLDVEQRKLDDVSEPEVTFDGGGLSQPVPGSATWGGKQGKVQVSTDLEAFASDFPGAARAVELLDDVGLGHLWQRVGSIHVTTNSVIDGDGALYERPDGTIELWIDRDFLDNDAALRDLINHEIGGHLLEGAYGSGSKLGKVSAGKDWSVKISGGSVTPAGAVAKELVNLYNTHPGWKGLLEYPLNSNDPLTAKSVSEELFAQATKAFLANPNAVIARAPLTAKVIQNAIDSEAATQSEARREQTTGDSKGRDSQNNRPGQSGRPASEQSLPRKSGGGSAAVNLPPYMAKAPSNLRVLSSLIGSIVKDAAITRVAFTKDLLDRVQSLGLMPSAREFGKHLNNAVVEKTKMERKVSDILDKFNQLMPHERGTGAASVNKFMHDSTLTKKWGFKPDWIPGFKDEWVDPVMARRFNTMSREARAVIEEVFKHGHTSLQELQQAALDSIKSEVDPLIAQAKADGDTATVKQLEKAKADLDGRFKRLFELRSSFPYAPLRRFGNWAVSAKSQALRDAISAGDDKLVAELEKSGDHYRVEFVDNRFQAERRKMELQQTWGDGVDAFERTDEAGIYGAKDIFGTFSRLRNMAKREADDSSTKEGTTAVVKAMDTALGNIYLQLLSETSARQSEQERKGIHGADLDMMRSFATQGRSIANYIGSLRSSGKVMDALNQMRREAYRSSDKTTASVYYNELARRHAMGIDYEPNQLLDRSLAFTSFWSLITSPSYLLTNMTQPLAVSVPYMAGKFGYGRSFNEMIKAYKEVGKLVTELVKSPEAVSELPDDVRQAVQELFDRGRIDISMQQDLGGFESSGSGKTELLLKKAAMMPRTLAERGEMLNRVATAVATYRLAKQNKMSHEAAVNAADDVIYRTHGDYSGANAPRFMRTGFGRLATQFRKFQLIQISLYAKMASDAYQALFKDKNLTTAEKWAATAPLRYSLLTMFALGGTMALPGFTAISFIMGSVLGMGDDDEPDDPEATLRRLWGGEEIADLMVKGIPAMVGLDISNRVGAGGMLSILPYTDLEASRDGYKDIVLGVLGPFLGGLLPKAVDGVGLIAKDDYWKGLEMLAPRGIADMSKAIRFGTDGVTKRNGDVVLSGEEVSFLASAGQFIGLPTTTITENQLLRNSQFKADEFYKNRTTDLKRRYVEAYRDNDVKALAKVREEWMSTQEARKALGIKPQPLSTLIKAPQEQKKREAKPLNRELVE